MGQGLGCTKIVCQAYRLGFADACLCRKAGLTSLESTCSGLIVGLLNQVALVGRGTMLGPQTAHSWV